jgi:tetratricopeptide (TPR) repeat protein
MKSFSVFAAIVFFTCPAFIPKISGQAADPKFDDLARRAEQLLETRPSEAADLYRQALAIKPDWTEGWFYLGASLYQADRYAEATDAFRKTVALTPDHGTAWAFLGMSEAEMDNRDQALADIRKGIELGLGTNQDFEIAARVKAARLLILSSAFDEALREMQPIARLKANSQAVVDTMGLCVLTVPSKLSELSRERRAVVSLAGRAAWASVTQRPAEATASYRELLEKYPNEPGVHYANGLYLLETDMTAALAEFEKEVQNNPKHWPSRIDIASLQLRQGDPDESIKTLRETMRIAPSRFRWLLHAELGRANLSANNLDAAIAELNTAVRLKADNPQVHFMLSQAYRRAGRADDASRENAEFQKLKVQQDPLGVPSLRTFANAAKN